MSSANCWIGQLLIVEEKHPEFSFYQFLIMAAPLLALPEKKLLKEIDRYNETNKRIAQKKGSTYIDITLISREAEEKPEYIASDNLHPSGIIYAKWVKEVINHINLNAP